MLKILTIGENTVGTLQSIETKMADALKGLPQLPDSSKEALANIWPWLALIGGLLQLWAALILYHLANFASRIIDATNALSVYYTGQPAGPSSFDKTLIYVGVLMLVVDAVLMLMAFPKLQNRQKSGWDLLFLAALINVVYGVVQIFTYGRGIGSFLFNLIGSALAFYLLFQIRGKYTGRASISKTSTPKIPTAK